jgi:hypothetical protein
MAIKELIIRRKREPTAATAAVVGEQQFFLVPGCPGKGPRKTKEFFSPFQIITTK